MFPLPWTLDDMIMQLQGETRFEDGNVRENRIKIEKLKAMVHERLQVLDRLTKSNQDIRSHPRSFMETALTSNTDGFEVCGCCGKQFY